MAVTKLLWDAGDVIYPFNFKPAFESIAANATVPRFKNPKEVNAILFGTTTGHEYNAGITEANYLGKESDDSFYERAKEVLGLTFSRTEFEHVFSDIFTVNSRVARFIEAAQKAGYDQAVVSSTCPMHWAAMRRTIDQQTGKHFDMEALLGAERIITTYKLGVKKPHDLLFATALKTMDAKKEEAVYIDDVLKYVVAAQAYGLAVVHMNTKIADPQGDCIKKLEQLLGSNP